MSTTGTDAEAPFLDPWTVIVSAEFLSARVETYRTVLKVRLSGAETSVAVVAAVGLDGIAPGTQIGVLVVGDGTARVKGLPAGVAP